MAQRPGTAPDPTGVAACFGDCPRHLQVPFPGLETEGHNDHGQPGEGSHRLSLGKPTLPARRPSTTSWLVRAMAPTGAGRSSA